MIPGSGEYVYDTVIQKKQIITQNGSVKCEKVINSHNLYNIANSIHSLNQLKNTCENIEWVAPVVCWFGLIRICSAVRFCVWLCRRSFPRGGS